MTTTAGHAHTWRADTPQPSANTVRCVCTFPECGAVQLRPATPSVRWNQADARARLAGLLPYAEGHRTQKGKGGTR